MNYKMSSEVSEKLISKIISVAYGNASWIDRIQVKKLIKKDLEIKALYENYCKTAEIVHSLKIEEYENKQVVPEEQFNAVYKNKSTIEEIYSIFLGKPIVYSSAVTVLLISILFSVFSNREITYNGYTLAEVKKANIDSRQAISIVAGIFNKTSTTLKTDILYKEVSAPIKEGINTVNKLFNKEIEK